MFVRMWMLSMAVMVLPAFALADDQDKEKDKPFNDTEFVKMAASAGMAEVEAGKLGQERATAADVKAFAQKMVTDHTKVNKELMNVASGMNIMLDKTMTKHHQKAVSELKEVQGAGFDKTFMKHMVKDHEKAVAAFRRASKEATNAELKQFAAKTLPVLEEHGKMAREINTKLGGSDHR